MQRFKARLEAVPHGGHMVVIPPEIASAAGLVHGSRVRGTCNGAAFRTSTPRYSGKFHMGIHKATLAEANAKPDATVTIELELDDELRAGDVAPPDLMAAIRKAAGAGAAWKALAPSHRREHVKPILEAKKPETRARRVAKTIAMLSAVPKKKR